jgi:hypothetical protein
MMIYMLIDWRRRGRTLIPQDDSWLLVIARDLSMDVVLVDGLVRNHLLSVDLVFVIVISQVDYVTENGL